MRLYVFVISIRQKHFSKWKALFRAKKWNRNMFLWNVDVITLWHLANSLYFHSHRGFIFYRLYETWSRTNDACPLYEQKIVKILLFYWGKMEYASNLDRQKQIGFSNSFFTLSDIWCIFFTKRNHPIASALSISINWNCRCEAVI